jgi:hypothetical protein
VASKPRLVLVALAGGPKPVILVMLSMNGHPER